MWKIVLTLPTTLTVISLSLGENLTESRPSMSAQVHRLSDSKFQILGEYHPSMVEINSTNKFEDEMFKNEAQSVKKIGDCTM